MALPVKLFLVPIDGPRPSEWTPFGNRKLAQLATDFSDAGKHIICATNIRLEITTTPIAELKDEVMSRVVGCIVNLKDLENEVSDGWRSFAYRMKEKNKVAKTTKLYLLANVGSCEREEANKLVVSAREKLSLQGFTANDIVIYTMRTDDDIGTAMNFMTTNILTNELVCPELSGS